MVYKCREPKRPYIAGYTGCLALRYGKMLAHNSQSLAWESCLIFKVAENRFMINVKLQISKKMVHQLVSYPEWVQTRSFSKHVLKIKISGLPDAILAHILSFLRTKCAVRTCILSHRWNNVWTYVPNFEADVNALKSDSDVHVREAGFVDRVLLFRNVSNIHKFHLGCLGIEDYFDRVVAWVCTAIRCNVVELKLDLWTTPSNSYTGCLKLPTSIFICKTLVVLKLVLTDHVVAIPPQSNCFPSLKYLEVQLCFRAYADSVAKLLSCGFSALENLIIHGNLGRIRKEVLNLNISAPKLKSLHIKFCAVHEDDPFASDGGYEYKIFVNANAPNLEKFNVKYLLASYSLKNLELCLQTCCSWQSLPIFLNASPNLEYLVLENMILMVIQTILKIMILTIMTKMTRYMNGSLPAPAVVPICLLSCLKTVYIREFRGRIDEVEVAGYLLKHVKVLKKVTIHTSNISQESVMELWQTFSSLPRGSKTCEIEWILPKL
ncbi:putative FBD-associated F-box protein At5g56440 [Argentina anserina]|uniref:putative FBD-associated F-box protein At5g56440 n=1 Tax=Argentina anserina TaxID=57926 RepID=UPI0021766A84|nr:putative FBD-associated F-box protein At5g56440 [Potentilla anserina]